MCLGDPGTDPGAIVCVGCVRIDINDHPIRSPGRMKDIDGHNLASTCGGVPRGGVVSSHSWRRTSVSGRKVYMLCDMYPSLQKQV